MFALQLNEAELMDAWQEQESGDPARWKVVFPTMGAPEIGSFGSVYFEIEPGQELPVHTDSQDEIVILLSGSGEGVVANETSQLSAGGMVFVPAMVPHGFRNTGRDTIRAIGIFAGTHVVSTFDREVLPMGIRVFDSTQIPAGV